GVAQAPAPARLIEGGMVSTALVAQIAVAKYAWLSTLYRQTLILAGQGVVLDRQTLARWMKQAAWMLEGLYELQLATMHRCPRLFCDETPMPVLAPGRVKTSQFWAHATDDRPWAGPAPPAVAYVFAGGRGKKGDRGAARRLLGCPAGRRLRRLQGAGQRCRDQEPRHARFLPRACAPQLRPCAQDDEVALRPGSHREHCRDLRDRETHSRQD